MDDSRASSAKNSRRRRWEVKSKESFETSLAVEIENSPVRKDSSNKFRPDDGPSQERPSKTSDDKSKELPKQNERLPTKSSLKPSSATSRATGPKSARSKPSSAKSKPSSAKSTSGSKTTKPDSPNDRNDTDLLSEKLGALIEGANGKSKDPRKRSAKEKEKTHTKNVDLENISSKDDSEGSSSSKDDSDSNTRKQSATPSPIPNENLSVKHVKDSPSKNIPKTGTPYHRLSNEPPVTSPMNDISMQTATDNQPGEIRNVRESPLYSDDPPKYSERDGMYLEESSPEPSAPPFTSISPSPEWLPKKKKKARKKKSESKMLLLNAANDESFISLQLKELKDDIVDITKDNRIVAAPGLLRASSLPTVHGNYNAVFQERIGGFVMTRHGDESSPKLSERLQDPTQAKTRTSHAVFLQSGFRTFSVLCQGLLAGLTLAHCLLIFLLEIDPGALPSLYNSRMAHIFYALVIFLTTICFTSACDRCDLSGVGVFSGHGLKIPWTPAFYLSSLVLSLVAIRTEDVLAHNTLYKETLQDKIKQLVDWWRWMCVARSSMAVLAWLAVVPDPHTDALLDSIQELNQK